MNDLFENQITVSREKIGEQAIVLRNFATKITEELITQISHIETVSPFRNMSTPGGHTMSVGLTNCGQLGWTSDQRGYRYTSIDPLTHKAWPQMPDSFLALAHLAALEAGFENFQPDACLINLYTPGTKLSLHQDKDEPDLSAPIVSVSLGITAIFQFGGFERSDKKIKVPLTHGDVVVWGGVDRLRYHGILPIKAANHPLLGEQRINLTFRKAFTI